MGLSIKIKDFLPIKEIVWEDLRWYSKVAYVFGIMICVPTPLLWILIAVTKKEGVGRLFLFLGWIFLSFCILSIIYSFF